MPMVSVCKKEEFLEAIKKGDVDFLENNNYLASYYDLIDEQGNTILHWAIESGSELLIKKIIEDGFINSIINTANHQKNTPLHLAVQKNNYALIQALLEQKANPNLTNANENTPLHLACRNYKHVEAIQLLLQHGAKATIKNRSGISPLAEMLPPRLNRSKEELDELYTVMQLLLQAGAKDNFRYEFGFDDFVCYGEPKHVAALIAAGASLESRCHKHTPLLRAASSKKADIVKVLLQHGANIRAITSDGGESALHLAIRYRDISTVKVLLAYNADPNMEASPLNPHFVQNRIWREALSKTSLTTKQELYDTPFHLAASYGDVEIVKLLIEAGADVNKPSKNGTPLHYTIGGIQTSFLHHHHSAPLRTAELLLNNGADITATYYWPAVESFLTPLQYAQALFRSSKDSALNEMIELLVSHENVRNKKLMPHYFY